MHILPCFQRSVVLLANDIPDLVEGGNPRVVADAHRLWESSMVEWGPWKQCRESAIDLLRGIVPHAPLQGWISARTGATRIFLCAACSSALDVGWQLLRWNLLQEWDAVIAVTQWSGRGQVRRPWQSLPGNLHVAWRAPPMASHWDGLTSLVPAWLTARTLSRLGIDLRLKWPNDLLWDGRKVGGVLAEQRGKDVMVGLGLNLADIPGLEVLRKGAACPAGSLDGRIDPLRCWEMLVSQSRLWYTKTLPAVRPDDVARDFSDMLAGKDQHILVFDHSHEQGVRGRMLGVSSEGGLVVSIHGTIQHIFSGEIRFIR